MRGVMFFKCSAMTFILYFFFLMGLSCAVNVEDEVREGELQQKSITKVQDYYNSDELLFFL